MFAGPALLPKKRQPEASSKRLILILAVASFSDTYSPDILLLEVSPNDKG
jgi:hypothetical protein